MVDKFNFEFGNPDLPAFQNVKFEFEEVFVPFYRRYFYDKGAAAGHSHFHTLHTPRFKVCT